MVHDRTIRPNLSTFAGGSLQGVIEYPQTRRDDILEELHGRFIADPYRWLEDPDSSDTADWVSRQNEVTNSYLDQLETRGWFRDTMSAIMHRPRAGVPIKKAGRYFVSRNDGSLNQDIWYVGDSLQDLLEGGQVVVDPNLFSADGSDSLLGFTVSDDGHYFAYTLSEGGSDWNTFVLLDLHSGEQVDDAQIQTKFSEPTWLPDCSSYLYTDFAHQGHAAGTETTVVASGKLRLHRVGQPQEQDELILEFPENDQLMCWPQVSADHQLVIVSIGEGTENRNRLWVYKISRSDQGSIVSAPLKIVDEARAKVDFIRSVGSTLFLYTDLDAPRGRVVSCQLDEFESSGQVTFTEVIGEGGATLTDVVAAGDQLITVVLDDAQPILSRYSLDGHLFGDLDLSGGSLVALHAEADDPEGFVGLSSVTSPTEAYRFEVQTGDVRPLTALVRGASGAQQVTGRLSFTAPEVVLERRAATSKDGTAVPYFVVAAIALDRSRPQPTLLYGYGGFKIPVLADYRPGWSAWLAAGGVLAIANLRGGGEFGTQWYDGGRLANKQNVFDDFIAVAEALKDSGVTTTSQLALHGRSNGGLLVSAVMTQRPDLAAAVLPTVGVLDLLRFHLFTIGAAWISDYGNPDDPDQFADALAYSPLHNIEIGTRYPATLVLTGDHDDRVVPLHSHKFTASLQYAQEGEEPVLTRVEVATGHGIGKPMDKVVDEWADLLAFAAHHTGLKPGEG
jgi:prolyl oligopeptidase